MTAVALNPMWAVGGTGSYLGSRVPDRSQSTLVDYRTVGDPGLQALFSQWDESLAALDRDPVLRLNPTVPDSESMHWHTVLRTGMNHPLRVFQAATSSHGQPRTLYAIHELMHVLDLPARDICKAAGISRRTYYSWLKAPHTQARLGSESRLWELVEVVEDLRQLVEGELRQWIRHPARRKTLVGGHFNDLLLDATSERSRNHPMDPLGDWSPVPHDANEPVEIAQRVPRQRRQASVAVDRTTHRR